MSWISEPERATQQRVIALFCNELGYRYLGDWSERSNRNIEPELVSAYLTSSGYTPAQISRALDVLQREADNHGRVHCAGGAARRSDA